MSLGHHSSSSMPDPAHHFRAELTRLRNSRRHPSPSQTTQLAIELAELLHMPENGIHDPAIGIRLMTSFFTADARFASQSDDSYGSLGKVYRNNAGQNLPQRYVRLLKLTGRGGMNA